ncbi:hypothetical protein EMCRGX_G020394 [Ephydatia muelleri]
MDCSHHLHELTCATRLSGEGDHTVHMLICWHLKALFNYLQENGAKALSLHLSLNQTSVMGNLTIPGTQAIPPSHHQQQIYESYEPLQSRSLLLLNTGPKAPQPSGGYGNCVVARYTLETLYIHQH